MERLIGKSIFILLLLFSNINLVHAADNLTIRCDSCTETAKQSSVKTWALQNMTSAEVNRPIGTKLSKTVDVIDLKSESVSTYIVELKRVSAPAYPVRPPVWHTNSVISTATSDTTKQKFNNVKIAMKGLKEQIQGMVIPATVVENAWSFLNCLYCNNVVQDYVRAETNGKIESVWLTIQSLALTVGVFDAPLPSTYSVKLENGGYITVEVTINAQMQLLVKIIQVVDESSNTVPRTHHQLANMNLYLVSPDANEIINRFLNPFGFGIPSGRVGIVTIQDCKWDPTKNRCNIE